MSVRSNSVAIALLLILGLLLVACEEPRPLPASSPSTLPPGSHLTSLSFVDAAHGWVVASNCDPGKATPATSACRALVYATVDGGQSWSPGARLLLVPRKIQFVDESTGWLIGSIGQQCGNSPCPNVVMRTTDAGRTWERTSTTSADLVDLSFASHRDGWVLGRQCATPSTCKAVLVSTQSDGQSWTNQELPVTGALQLDRASPAIGWIGGIENGRAVLLGTRDDGKTWERIGLPCGEGAVAFDFQSRTDGWLVCSGSTQTRPGDDTVYRTADAGQTWRAVSSVAVAQANDRQSGGAPRVIHVSSSDAWILDGRGNVLVTRDGGKSWEIVLKAGGPLVGATLVDGMHGWAVGGQTIWRTNDAGRTWTKLPINGGSARASVTMRVE
jgi:photosystem II stability/assembly factor-like uncharacterized protein